MSIPRPPHTDPASTVLTLAGVLVNALAAHAWRIVGDGLALGGES